LKKLGKNSIATSILAILIGLSVVYSTPSIKAVSEAPQPQWSKTYGGYRGNWVIQTADGGYAIAGVNATYKPYQPHSPPNWWKFTPLLVKTDGSGNMKWKQTYASQVEKDSTYYNEANSVVQTEDLGYALCGGNWLLKLDVQGNLMWNKTFGRLQHCRGIHTSDGGYVLVGVGYPNGQDTVLLKTDASGELLWNRTFSSGLPSVDVWAGAVIETNDKGHVLAGTWGGTYFWFAKTDSNGNLKFNKTYDFSSNGGYVSSVANTDDGGYILAGWDERPDWNANRAWLIKTDAQGNAQWYYRFEQPYGATFRSVAQTDDGGYIAVGNPALVKVDSSGNLQWNTTHYGNSVIVTSDGGYAIAGWQGDFIGSDQQLMLAKFAPESNTPPENTSPPVPTDWIVAATAIIAISAAAGYLIYKRRK
jgi:hypothetical protein